MNKDERQEYEEIKLALDESKDGEVYTEEEVKDIIDLEQPEPTTQEKIDKLNADLEMIKIDMDFIDRILPLQKGDKIVVKDIYCEVVKRTKTGMLDLEAYELDGTIDEPKFGKWLEKRRFTPKGLAQSKVYAKVTMDRISNRIKELEEEIDNQSKKEDDMNEET